MKNRDLIVLTYAWVPANDPSLFKRRVALFVRVPLHPSGTCEVLADYIGRRKRHWAQRPVSSYLFVSSWGNRLDAGDIHRTFYALSRQIGLRGPSDSHGPRLHDFRQNAESRKMPSDALSVCPSDLIADVLRY